MALDQKLERQFLARIVRDADASAAALQRKITGEVFQWSTAAKLYSIATWYTQNYGACLSVNELDSLLKKSATLPPDVQQSIAVLFTELQAEPLDTDINFLYDQILSYHKQNLLEHALRRSAERFSDKKIDESITGLKDDLAKIDTRFRQEVVRSGTLDVDVDKLLLEYDDNKLHPERYRRLMIGFPSIDNAMKGLPKGSLYTIIAPWKGFKSTLLKCIAVNLAKTGKFVYLHSNEDTRETFHARVAATELQVPFANILDKNLSPEQESKWVSFLNDSKNGVNPIMKNIYFDEVLTSSTSHYISTKVKELNNTRPVDVILIDHFGRMESNNVKNIPTWEKMGEIAKQLSMLSLELRLPMIMTAHSNLQGTRAAKEDSTNISPEDLGLSSQPLKEVSGSFSFVIENLEDFKRNGSVGFAKFVLNLSRYSGDAFATLSVNGPLSDIKELHLGGTTSVPVAAQTTP
jgi:hypothetical protein